MRRRKIIKPASGRQKAEKRREETEIFSAAAREFPAESGVPPACELSLQDKILWTQVARTVRPLRKTGLHKGRKNAPAAARKAETARGLAGGARKTETMRGAGKAETAQKTGGPVSASREFLPEARQNGQNAGGRGQMPGGQAPAAARAKAAPGGFDRGAYRKLAQGSLPIEAKIDLHDHTQEEAHYALLYFVQKARERGLRHILIITGKGRSHQSDGILQKQVPHWLAAAPFRLYIAAVEQAARLHGGEGAFYVRLRRRQS